MQGKEDELDIFRDLTQQDLGDDMYWFLVLTDLKNVATNCVDDDNFSECSKKLRSMLDILSSSMKRQFKYKNQLEKKIEEIFTESFADINTRLTRLTQRSILQRSDSSGSRTEANRITFLLNLPSSYFPNWEDILRRYNIPLTGQTPTYEKKRVEVGFTEAVKQRTIQEKKVQEKPQEGKEMESPPKKVAATRKKRDPKSDRADLKPFHVVELYNRHNFSNKWPKYWTSNLLLYDPMNINEHDEWLNETVFTIVMHLKQYWKTLIPTQMDDIVLLVQQVQFWLAQYQADVISPCSFKAPNMLRTSVDNHSIFRDNIMQNLIKLVFLFNHQNGIFITDLATSADLMAEDRTGQETFSNWVRNAKFIPYSVWKDYITIQFPLAAYSLFPQKTLSEQDEWELQNDFKRVYKNDRNDTLTYLREMQKLFVLDEEIPPVRPKRRERPQIEVQKKQELDTRFIRLEAPGTCLNDEDISNFLRLIQGSNTNTKKVLFDSYIDSLSDPKRVVKSTLAKLKIDNPSLLIFIRHVEGNHWITIAVTKPKEGAATTAIIFDSLGSRAYNNEAKKLFKFIFNSVEGFSTFSATNVKYFFNENDAIQDDITSCGLFSLIITQALFQENMGFLLKLRDEKIQLDETEMRRFLAQELREKQLFDLNQLINQPK
jgi:hypothetical protein